MKQQELTCFFEATDKFFLLFDEYKEITNRMLDINPEEEEVFSEFIEKRQETIEDMNLTKITLLEFVESQEEEKKLLFKRMFNNQPIMKELLPDEKAVFEKVERLRAMQQEAINLDNILSSKIKSMMEDIKYKLEQLQTEKKKYDYYDNLYVEKTGRNFNSQS